GEKAMRNTSKAAERRGVVLLVVMSMLALFAVVGLGFVYYADSESTASRMNREKEAILRPYADAEFLLSHFLGQFIFGTNDESSALRGHDLARLLYGGYNPNDASGINRTMKIIPYDGPGAMRYTFSVAHGLDPLSPFAGNENFTFINFTDFQADWANLGTGLKFKRDPEYWGLRGGPGNQFLGGANVGWTYPDLYNVFLAAVNADGEVLAQSFHRPYTGYGPMDPGNPNHINTANPALRYLPLRPHKSFHPFFPMPDDGGGDVKNLDWAKGVKYQVMPATVPPTYKYYN